MKRSRTGVAIVFIIFIVVTFSLGLMTLSLFSSPGSGESLWSDLLESENKIAVLKVEGTIMSSDNLLKQLRKFSKKSSVKAILLRINSPGGAVAPAQEIYREIEKVKKKKPVVASIETLGTSAAYYIASRADQVVCSRGTITGSIGVIMMLTEIRKAIEWLGVDVTVIKAGKYKDIGSAVRAPTEEEKKILNDFAKQIHEQFIEDVAAAREGKIKIDKLREVADGSFFTGERALELGLVDSIGNFYDAVKVAAKLAKIEGQPELVYPEKKWNTYVDYLLGSVLEVVNRATDRAHGINRPPSVR
ncbi:signal peptide peptidase SppA [Thermodesulfobacteriota bacterium]